MSNYLFTSESVGAGHPDKMADNISDAILDALIAETARQKLPVANVRCACETLVKTGVAIVAGEVRADVFVDIEKIVRDTVRAIGYKRHKVEHVKQHAKQHAHREKGEDKSDIFGFGFDADTCSVMNLIGAQSADIAQGVDADRRKKKKIGAGDQGLMFGYACRETKELMPAPIQISHELMRRHAKVRLKKLPWLGPDAKAQVSMRYIDGKPAFVESVVLSSQHDKYINKRETKDDDRRVHSAILEHIIKPVLGKKLPTKDKIFINPTGSFIDGGPKADCGLTGRKIIVDTYGGAAPHGGGAFSGKDPTKVDRSAAYMMRHVAKNIVKAKLAKKCLVQTAYAIGVAEPVSVMIDTYGTGTMPDEKLERLVRKVFDLTPGGIIKTLDLWRPIYKETAAYGHFGREDDDFTWEQTDKVDALIG